MHPLLRYLLIGIPASVLVFLTLAGFWSGWDGRAVSHRPAATEDPAVLTVLIVTDEGDGTEVDWPADLVRDLGLRADPTGVPPSQMPDVAPATYKAPFSMFFTVTPTAGEPRVVDTKSARALSVAVVVFVLGLGLFNMWRSGSPWSWERRARHLPEPQPVTGQVDGSDARPSSRKGPPPPRRRRGQGRRR